jgi:hypothetical protein
MEREEIDYSQYVYYDETSPTCLRWKVDRSGGTKAGDTAGYCYLNKAGRLESKITICNADYTPHRVVWCLHNKAISTKERLKFIDGNKLNNKIDNLEVAVKQIKPKKPKQPLLRDIYGDRPSRIFSGMKTRCGYNPSEGLVHYEDKTIHQEWLDDPTSFYKFVAGLDNYNSVDDKGKPFHIEKDLFGFNSDLKGYHPDTVCFLPNDLNQVIQLEHPNQRTKNKGLPLGVTEDRGRFKAQISNGNGKPRYLGSGTIEECSALYKKAKIERIEELTDKWKHMLSDKILNQISLFVSHLKAF